MEHTKIWELPVESYLGKRPVMLDDTTLRDGEQTAGVVFTNAEKVQIAKYLDEIGVHQIEAGIPVMGGDEAEVITEIAHLGLKASVLGWNRSNVADRASRASVTVAMPCSSPRTTSHIPFTSILTMPIRPPLTTNAPVATRGVSLG